MQRLNTLMVITLALLVVACTPMRLYSSPPKMQVDSVQLLPSQGLSQRFEIGLRIVNVDSKPLLIRGLHFELALNGYELLDGVSAKETRVEPYSEEKLVVIASTNLISSLQFLNQWVQGDNATDFAYALKATVDVKGSLTKIPISQSGTVSLVKK